MGSGLLEKLNGMWSFAIYDRAKKRIVSRRATVSEKSLSFIIPMIAALFLPPNSPRFVSILPFQKMWIRKLCRNFLPTVSSPHPGRFWPG